MCVRSRCHEHERRGVIRRCVIKRGVKVRLLITNRGSQDSCRAGLLDYAHSSIRARFDLKPGSSTVWWSDSFHRVRRVQDIAQGDGRVQ